MADIVAQLGSVIIKAAVDGEFSMCHAFLLLFLLEIFIFQKLCWYILIKLDIVCPAFTSVILPYSMTCKFQYDNIYIYDTTI